MRAPVVPTFTPPPRRRSLRGLGASAVFHTLLLVLLLSPYFRRYHLFSATGSDLPGTGGGGGAGEQYIALPALRSFAAKPPAPPVVHVEVPVVTAPVTPPTVIPPPSPAVDTTPSAPAAPPSDSAGGTTGNGPGKSGGSGGGNGGGQGPGSGGGAGPGTGGGERGRPPEIRGFPVPPTEGTPKALRGKELPIRCYVGLDGKVERFEFGIDVADGGFRRALADVIAGFKFAPARDSTGAAVRGVALVTLTLSNR